jgi:hypothetical protein
MVMEVEAWEEERRDSYTQHHVDWSLPNSLPLTVATSRVYL